MHEHVGVAANGRGEVCVIFERETEVPDIFGRVNCFGHRAQCCSADEMLFGLAVDLLKQASRYLLPNI